MTPPTDPIPASVPHSFRAARLAAMSALAAPLLFGCSQSTMTNPARAVSEQLVLSTATDRAIATTSFSLFDKKKVFLDATYFDSYDSKYVVGAIRDALSQAGAVLLPTAATNCDIIIEARSGGLSTDPGDTLLGLANTGIPIPLVGAVPIPEIAIYKASWQFATAKFALLAYDARSREHYFSSGPMVGKSYNENYKLLGIIQWTRSDIPEKKRKHKQ